MGKFLLRKAIFTSLSLFAVILFTFGLMHFIPGDPFLGEQALPVDLYEALRTHYGLNEPLHIQFFGYIARILHLDFGQSIVFQGRSVVDIIKLGLPASATLAAFAVVVAVPTGLLLGIYAGLNKGRWQDRGLLIAAVIGVSLPSFILATLLQYTLGIKLHLLPIARWGTFPQIIMPGIALATLPIAFIARLTRAKLIAEMQVPYVMTARAKGLTEFKIVWTHVLRNILPPVLSYLGPLIASIVTGSFIIEKIFAIPGLGYWYVASVMNRDYPLIIGITLFYCATILTASLIVDLISIYLDPRIILASNDKKDIA